MRQTGGDFSLIIALLCREVNHHHPLLYLRGVASQDMAALLDFMYHGETNVAEADLERFLAVAEDLEVRGLTGGETTEGTEGSRREADVDLDTAVDDDVNSLLAGLDDQPAPKRVKQERHEAGQQQAGGFTITTPSGVQPAASVQEKIRVKAEQRIRVSLPPSLPSYQPAQPVTLTRPATSSSSSSSSEQLRQLLATSASSLQSQPLPPPPRYPSAPVRPPLSSPVAVVRSPQPRMRLVSPVVSAASHPANPLLYPGQPLLPPDVGRLQVEQNKDGSPPVLHLPDNFGNFMLDPNMPALPAGSEGRFQVPDGRGGKKIIILRQYQKR